MINNFINTDFFSILIIFSLFSSVVYKKYSNLSRKKRFIPCNNDYFDYNMFYEPNYYYFKDKKIIDKINMYKYSDDYDYSSDTDDELNYFSGYKF
jgi:hypothetical protein